MLCSQKISRSCYQHVDVWHVAVAGVGNLVAVYWDMGKWQSQRLGGVIITGVWRGSWCRRLGDIAVINVRWQANVK